MLGLLVGPQNDLWKQLDSWLRQQGWETLQISACIAARKELEKNPDVDLVLIDADTTDTCGLQLIRSVRGEPRLGRIPIIIAGADIDQTLALKYAEMGVDNILLLPTLKDTFEAKVRRAVQNGKPRILIVDDEEMIRELLHDCLKLERYSPVTASTVDEALAIIHTQPIDAIVTDIMMPGKTGLDLLIEVKHDYPHIPVIMITGLTQRYGPKDVIALGADGYFAKPFHNLELVFTLRKVLANRERLNTNRTRSLTSQPK